MAVKAKCFITNSEEGRGAFGIRADNDEPVYFPHTMANSMELEELDEVDAILVKNDRPEPPWRAIRAKRLGDDDEDRLST
ncbi:hypothetical protein BH10PSE13_BH10PSE13_07180 [soil metagenome]